MNGTQMRDFFDKYGDKIMEMFEKRNTENTHEHTENASSGNEIQRYFEENGDKIMSMIRRREGEKESKGLTEKTSQKNEVQRYFEEHGDKIVQMSIKKSFEEGIADEKKGTGYLKKIQDKNEHTQEVAKSFGIKPYLYYSEFSEIKQLQNNLIETYEQSFNGQSIGVALDEAQNLTEIAQASYDFRQSASNSKNDYKNTYLSFVKEQDNALIHAMNQEALIILAEKDVQDLKCELSEINNRTLFAKAVDFFNRQSKTKKERATEIQRAIEIIEKRINEIKKECEKPSMPLEKIKPEQVVANLARARDCSTESLEKTYNGMIEYIREHFKVNYREVNELCRANPNALPQVRGNSIRMTEQQKMDYFLQQQGYTQTVKSQKIEPLDPFAKWSAEKKATISQNRSKISKIAKMLHLVENTEVQRKTDVPIKGIGEGFNIVR